uniref:HTH araC/xylS-type domain-containing protein n=1 Tax=Batrachochytrium dendrobatidis (strain JAM81 / FGSC 10211) TaxID=684364 RepID=F4PEX4_BATDJ|eukprot:XP_006683153.1 hypothetical protein BATDEDRAFT_28718 [Batrachochytrium dendrobatidis JAM81]
MELSIYKQLATKEDFIAYLREKEMHRIGESRTYTSRIIINEEEKIEQTVIDFFFKLDSEETVEIGWANYWGSFFGDASKKTKTVESAFGMIIIEIDNSVYAISLGRGHSYANNFADMDFGFDIAEIIHDENSIEVKSAKFFKQSKNKSLTQYNTNSYVTSEIGESHELLVSKIDIDEKYSSFNLYSYEDKMKFGMAVKIEASSYSPIDIINIIHELHYISLNEEKSGNLPRMNFLKNNEDNQPMIADLNRGLLNALKNREPSVSLSYYTEEDGDILIEPANGDQVEIIYERRSYTLDSYSINSICEKLNEIECIDVSKVSVRPVNDRRNQLNLLKVIDYSTEYRGKDYCLYKGKWASFNKSYMDFIEREIVKVNECTIINNDFNLTEQALERGKKIQASDTDEYDQVNYTEYPYNIFLKDKFNFIILDRKKGQHFYKSVEFADLFDEDEQSLIHVKIEIIEWLTKVRMLGYVPEIIIAKDLRGTASNQKCNNRNKYKITVEYMKFEMRQPAKLLRPWIECYWNVELNIGANPKKELILPNGKIEMIFALEGIRFYPHGIFPFLDIPIHETVNQVENLHTIWGVFQEEVYETLCMLKETEKIYSTLNQLLINKISEKKTTQHQMIKHIVRHIKSKPNQSIPELVTSLGFTQRHLNRLFKDHTGINPKLLGQIFRFEKACSYLHTYTNEDTSTIASALGYYDQSHFNREFKRFSGMTPFEYKKRAIDSTNFL